MNRRGMICSSSWSSVSRSSAVEATRSLRVDAKFGSDLRIGVAPLWQGYNDIGRRCLHLTDDDARTYPSGYF